ncbi:hypothetical protein Cadr_000016239 [Camelus dromedarius]|uniref:Uncharacterized protein n=1 Tax=Camelus dromedarius TaxID=9838 RepID=A0A5N4E8K0_CAMDR|nr:hypothetical protein Cadr_000016239 [Camelus dromedarius]
MWTLHRPLFCGGGGGEFGEGEGCAMLETLVRVEPRDLASGLNVSEAEVGACLTQVLAEQHSPAV